MYHGQSRNPDDSEAGDAQSRASAGGSTAGSFVTRRRRASLVAPEVFFPSRARRPLPAVPCPPPAPAVPSAPLHRARSVRTKNADPALARRTQGGCPVGPPSVGSTVTESDKNLDGQAGSGPGSLPLLPSFAKTAPHAARGGWLSAPAGAR